MKWKFGALVAASVSFAAIAGPPAEKALIGRVGTEDVPMVVFSSGPPTSVVGGGIPLWGTIGGTGETSLDDFVLEESASIVRVGFYFQNCFGIDGWDETISYAFRSDAGGMPGGILATGSGQNVAALLTAFPCFCDGPAWQVEFDLQSSFDAAAGTKYWLELGGAGGPQPGLPWWVSTGPGWTGSSVVFREGAYLQHHIFDQALYLKGFAGGPELVEMTLKTSEIVGCKSILGTVTLSNPAPPEGVVLTLNDTLASASTPATLKILSGATSKTFTVKTVALSASEIGTVSATLGGQTLSQSLTVRPMGLDSMTLTPTSVVGSQPVVGKATLECKAGPGPITVDLSSNNAAVAYPIAASVVVPQGLKSVSFDVATSSVQAKSYATIAGTANGITKPKKLTVNSAASVSPTSLKFGSVPVGATSGPLNATLANKGAVPFSVNSISLTGTAASWFAQTNSCSASLAAGASCTLSVTFTPQAAATKSAKLTIATSATATPLSVSLSGTGELPP